jgi:hypothetical protein
VNLRDEAELRAQWAPRSLGGCGGPPRNQLILYEAPSPSLPRLELTFKCDVLGKPGIVPLLAIMLLSGMEDALKIGKSEVGGNCCSPP